MSESNPRVHRFSPLWRFRRRQSTTWKARIRAIQLALPDLIIRLDGEGYYLDVHAPFPEDLAAPLPELIGKNVFDVLPPEIAEHHMKAAEFVLRTGEVYEYEYMLDVPSGQQYFDSRLVKSGPNEITSIVRNITEKRRMQDQFEARRVELALERERRVILERFIQDASHDLRTPITALMTTGVLLERYVGELNAQLAELSEAYLNGKDTTALGNRFVDTIRRLTERQKVMTVSTERLKALVDAMFDMIRLDSDDELPMAPGSLTHVAETVVYIMQPEAERRGIELALEPATLPAIPLNSDMMQRAVQNLTINALNYTTEGGHVTIRLYQNDASVVLEVLDTGIGIAPQHLANIFHRFYRVDEARASRNGGTGLGLAIAHRVVQLHGGQIDVVSELGQGSIFRITLPKA